METKICKTCLIEKDLSEYYKHSRCKGNKRPTCKQCYNSTNKVNIDKFINYALKNARLRAKSNNLEFNLTPEWYKENYPEYCPVFNTKLDFTSKDDEYKPSIDRLNSAKGYTTDNCRIISWKANNIRNQWTLEELTAVVEYLKQL